MTMWIFTKTGFLSVIEAAPEHGEDLMVVRARVRSDLAKAFPGKRIFVKSERDYRFRAFVPRSEVKQYVWEAVDAIDYTNFKDAAAPNPASPRHRAYMQVWQAMADLQNHSAPGRPWGMAPAPRAKLTDDHVVDPWRRDSPLPIEERRAKRKPLRKRNKGKKLLTRGR